MQAFAAPTPLRLVQQRQNRCGTRVKTLLTIAEKPPAPAPGKRVPTFKKLQRRHREGPSFFRRAQAEQQEKEENPAQKEEKAKKRRITGRPGTPLHELVIGQVLSGTVQNIVPHGAFVDVGATRDGLVHVRDMAIDFVHTPRDVVRSGMRVRVWVKYVDPVQDVLGLTMVKPEMGFEGRRKVREFEVGSRYHGVVQRVTNFGAYVDIGAERLAFLHVSGVWGKTPWETLDYMRIGDRLWVSVIGVDEQKGHIRLFARGKNEERLTKDGELDSIVKKNVTEVVSPQLVVARPQDDLDEKEADETEDAEDSEDNDEEDDEWDEFDFVNEDEDAGDTIRYDELDDVAHMFNSNTDVVDVTLE